MRILLFSFTMLAGFLLAPLALAVVLGINVAEKPPRNEKEAINRLNSQTQILVISSVFGVATGFVIARCITNSISTTKPAD